MPYNVKYNEINVELLSLKKNTYMELANDGQISEENLKKLLLEIDSELEKH